MTTAAAPTLNGLNVEDLQNLIDSVAADPAKGQTRWMVSTRWQNGTVSQTRVRGCEIGGKTCPKDYTITIDEPLELGGTNTQPNPQEYLLAALNACMTVGYVAVASLMGVELTRLEIDSQGDIDLRGFLGISPEVKAGYGRIHYTVKIAGSGTPEQFRKMHEMVMATSPNRFNLSQPVKLTSELVLG